MIGYSFRFDMRTDDEAIEKLLKKSKAVIEFDVGSCDLWFNGMPGKALREVRDTVKDMVYQ